MIMHTDCDMSPILINQPENSFADVYFTPYWQCKLASVYQKPLARLVNQFISEIQVPAVEQHRASLNVAFGIKTTANKNLTNHAHVPGALVPGRMHTLNMPTSPWRGRPTMLTAAEPAEHLQLQVAVATHSINTSNDPVTPPRFTAVAIPSFPIIGALQPSLTVTPGSQAQPGVAIPPTTNRGLVTTALQAVPSPPSSDGMYGDIGWLASNEVFLAVDMASAHMANARDISAIMSSTSSCTLGSSISSRHHCTPPPAIESESESDTDVNANGFPPLSPDALRKYARPFPHVRLQQPLVKLPRATPAVAQSPISISSSRGSSDRPIA